MNASSVNGSAVGHAVDWVDSNPGRRVVSGSFWQKTASRPWLLNSFAIVSIIAINLGLTTWTQTETGWPSQINFGAVLIPTFLFLRFSIGLSWFSAGAGSLLFRWHPLMTLQSEVHIWTGVFLLTIIALSVQIGRRPHWVLGAALGLLLGCASANGRGFMGFVVFLSVILGLTCRRCASESNPRRTRMFWSWGAAALATGAAVVLLQITQIANAVEFVFGDVSGTPVHGPIIGSLAWVDRNGLLQQALATLPPGDQNTTLMGYFGLSCLALCAVAVWPSRAFSTLTCQPHYRIGVTFLALGLLAAWPLAGADSYQAQLTRLFAIVTVERQVDLATQHIVGIGAIAWCGLVITLLLAIRRCIGPARSAFPIFLASALTLGWMCVSPHTVGIERWIIPTQLLPLIQVLIAMGISVGAILGLQRLTDACRWTFLRLSVCLLIITVVAVDLATRPITAPSRAASMPDSNQISF